MNESDIDLGGTAAPDDDVFKDVPAGGFDPAKPGVAEGSLGGVNVSEDPGPPPEVAEDDRATDVQPEQESLTEPGTVGTFEPTPDEIAAQEEGPIENEALPDPDDAAEGTSSLSRITDPGEVDEAEAEAEGYPVTPPPGAIAPEQPEAPQEPASVPETATEPSTAPAAPQEPAGAAGGTLDATRASRRQGGTLSRDYMILEKLDLSALVEELCGSKLAPGIVNPIVAELKGVEVIVERTFDDRGQTIDRIRARNGQNALRAAGNMLPLGFEGQMAALSAKGLSFEPVKVGQREGRAVQVGGSS